MVTPLVAKISHNHLLIAYIAHLHFLNMAYHQVYLRGWVDETLAHWASSL